MKSPSFPLIAQLDAPIMQGLQRFMQEHRLSLNEALNQILGDYLGLQSMPSPPGSASLTLLQRVDVLEGKSPA